MGISCEDRFKFLNFNGKKTSKKYKWNIREQCNEIRIRIKLFEGRINFHGTTGFLKKYRNF